jgi:hypothetical protein
MKTRARARRLLVGIVAVGFMLFMIASATAGAAPLTATTEAATGIGLTGATLHGSVNPNGATVTSCQFEYGAGETGPYEHVAACEPAAPGSGTSGVPVSAQVEGLTPDTEYHFRLVAGNASNTSEGASLRFTAIEPVFGLQLGGAHAFGMSDSEFATEVDGVKVADEERPDLRAGTHPLDVTTRIYVNTESDDQLPFSLSPKDYYVNMPAGLAGSVARIPRCKMSEFSSLQSREAPSGCPTASQVGVVRLWLSENRKIVPEALSPVYNMVPPPGVPAELAFRFLDVAEPIVFQDRSDTDYGITGEIRNVSEQTAIAGSELTLWGVPANPAHDMERFTPANGTASAGTPPGDGKGGPLPADTAEVPFLTNPTRCGEAEAAVQADAWEHPGALGENGRPLPGDENWVTAQSQMFPGGVTGCGTLTFDPQLEVTTTTSRADSPSGVTVDLKMPQHEGPTDLATPALKDARITLPAGLAISPSLANGLEGCTPAQIKLHSMAQPECPNGSQVGSVEVMTPLVGETLTGQIYLSSQRQESTFHIYLVIRGSGVLLKLEGDVEANPQTGQLISTFDEDPQLLIGELKLKFYGGSDATLATPEACGRYTTTSLLEPWSHVPAPGEAHGTPNATPFSSFAVGSGCVSGFSPGFEAGMADPVAGAHTPFSVTISREDDEQELSGLQVTLPRGLVGKLAGVQECGDAQVAAAEHSTGAAEKASPSCPAGSQIGTVQVGAGPGEHPLFLPGKAYLTGPYKGAPYGLAIVVPALAGPFDLGTVVVRNAITVDPHTAQVTIAGDQFPRMLDGIPLKIRRVQVSANRAGFAVNPTNCEATKVTGVLSSFEGAHDAVASRFQVGDCGSLAFKPGFKAAAHAGHTRRNGAYLRVNVTSGPGQANIKSVLVKLPRALPARLSTLKLACPTQQFEENPAGCPAGSHVGTAIVHTPILSTPLTGPAIFVSHGGAAFPDLDVVLQGSGVTVDLTGNTSIGKGMTSSNFRSLPDVPVDSLELTLTAGPHSALAANESLCYQTTTKHGHRRRKRVKLTMPTVIGGQNGAVVEKAVHIAVEGCGKAGKHNKHRRK